MKRVLLLVVVAACGGGVMSHPSGSWDDTVASYSDARCRWEVSCDGYSGSATGCTGETSDVLTNQTKPELMGSDVDTCIACLQAYVDVYDADTSPCVARLTFDQQQAIAEACGSASCIDIHDLPGGGIQ